MSTYDSSLPLVMNMPFVREQILANAVALYRHLVKEVADKQATTNGRIDPREVIQVLLAHEKNRWSAVLVYGVPKIKGTLARGKAWFETHYALKELMESTGDALAVACQEELHISKCDQVTSSITKCGTFNKQFF